MAQKSTDWKTYINKKGTKEDFFIKLGEEYNIPVVKTGSKSAVSSALSEGKMVVAHMGKGNFTDSGHYVVLAAMVDNNTVAVLDPNGRSNADKRYGENQTVWKSGSTKVGCYSDFDTLHTQTVSGRYFIFG